MNKYFDLESFKFSDLFNCYVFKERAREGEKEGEKHGCVRDISVWLPLTRPQVGAWSAQLGHVP